MASAGIPSISTGQMREVDRLMIEELGITLVQMMENAGRALARLARDRFLTPSITRMRVVVLAGGGGNGGGGLACARNLHNWGADVRVITPAPPADLDDVPRHQRNVLVALGVPIDVATTAEDLPDADLVIDALIGYSLGGPPRGVTASLIRAANDHPAPTLALDVPSGIDATTGTVHEPSIQAAATLTLALPKHGLLAPEAAEAVGELYLADIGVPPDLYIRSSIGIRVRSPFATEDIVRLV
jgi:NAD(P)H-hydrate epimerase